MPTSAKKSKSKSKTKSKSARFNWKKAAIALARCAVFALKFDKTLGRGSGVVINLKTGKTEGPWQNMFFDALDGVGVVYDREKYYAEKTRARRIKRG